MGVHADIEAAEVPPESKPDVPDSDLLADGKTPVDRMYVFFSRANWKRLGEHGMAAELHTLKAAEREWAPRTPEWQARVIVAAWRVYIVAQEELAPYEGSAMTDERLSTEMYLATNLATDALRRIGFSQSAAKRVQLDASTRAADISGSTDLRPLHVCGGLDCGVVFRGHARVSGRSFPYFCEDCAKNRLKQNKRAGVRFAKAIAAGREVRPTRAESVKHRRAIADIEIRLETFEEWQTKYGSGAEEIEPLRNELESRQRALDSRDAQIHTLLVENPRRYLSEALERIGETSGLAK